MLWEEFTLPDLKRKHCVWVSRLAVWFAKKLTVKEGVSINQQLLEAAALLHDLDKNMHTLPKENHPDAAVRVLRERGMEEVARLVEAHPLHAIVDVAISPKTLEEKILYLSDKMVKHTIITVDERFALWRADRLPPDAVEVLDAAYPKVKLLEKELCTKIGFAPTDIAKLATTWESSTMDDET